MLPIGNVYLSLYARGMPMHALQVLLLASASATSTAQDAAPSKQVETFREEFAAYQVQAYRHLARSDDGLALVLASKLALAQSREDAGQRMQQPADSQLQRDHLIRRARVAAGDDALVWWSLAGDCPASASACDRASALERLREIEPDNALVWLVDLPKDSSETAAAVDAALAQAALATRFDTHFVERAARYAEVLATVEPSAALLDAVPAEFMVPATADGVQTMLALGFALAEATLPTSPVMSACRDAADEGATGRLADCRKIARVLGDASDSLVGASMGTKLRGMLATPGAELEEAELAKRKLDWLMLAGGELQAGNEVSPLFAAEMLARWRKPGATELSMLQDLLRDHGVPLDPPADWMPSAGWQAQPAAQPAR